MSSLKNTESLCNSNKARFHHNKPRICNLLKRENSKQLDQTEEQQKGLYPALPQMWWCHCKAAPPHLVPANLETSWAAANTAPHMVLPRQIPPRPPIAAYWLLLPCACRQQPPVTSSMLWSLSTAASSLPWEGFAEHAPVSPPAHRFEPSLSDYNDSPPSSASWHNLLASGHWPKKDLLVIWPRSI